MALSARLDDAQRRHRGLGFPIAVVYKYGDDQGGYLAALITYYGFLSLFPLLLLLSTVLGFVLDGNPQAQQDVLDSAAGQLPVIGTALADPARLGGSTTGLVVGLLGALYGGLGVAQAAQNAMNTAWRVPRNSRPNPFKVRVRSLQLLLTVGVALLGTTALSAVGGTGGFGTLLRAGVLVASVLLNAAVFVRVFMVGTSRPVGIAAVLPGAVTAAVVWQLLQLFGKYYVNHVIASASVTNSVFATVLGLIAFLYLASVVLVVCVEVNVVRTDRLYPRALLTPFTDHVDLTPGDRRAYRDQAKAQRSKGFEDVEVTFRPPPAD